MLYLLKRLDHTGYDEYDAMVIRADSKRMARKLANSVCGDEGHIWTDETIVTCEVLKQTGQNGIVLGSFNAG